jgi:hypothetical protein
MKTLLSILLTLTVFSSHAGDVTIVDAVAKKTGDQVYAFNVTLRHADSGWDHYADQWQVVSEEQQVLGTRTLYHPHVEEQPFTRSLGGVKIPSNVTTVIIRARDTVHGVSPQQYRLELPRQ